MSGGGVTLSTEQLILLGGFLSGIIGFLYRTNVKAWSEQRDFLLHQLERCQARGEQAAGQASRAIDVAADTVKKNVDA